MRRKDRKRVGGYLFLLLLKTSITCFRVCVTCGVPSRDPINLELNSCPLFQVPSSQRVMREKGVS